MAELPEILSEPNLFGLQIDKVCDMALDEEAGLEYCRLALRIIQNLNAQRTIFKPTPKENQNERK